MGYVTLTVEAGLSSKAKALKHSRGYNFDWILILNFIQVKVSYVAQTSGNTFLQWKSADARLRLQFWFDYLQIWYKYRFYKGTDWVRRWAMWSQ